ncbi:hypothetical protein PUR71_02120 [Streptomyces sp. SP17BM10]|uniref:hypothetical protein n=1 Tax=Streptomyces sp. SP17BM10 TaxID=3002530 RepID=UPI002E786499|nr:hypothetical protein [Streptomyces sp. SP17BM10]MEE1781734.1 hypothetical protein [Streptomyces sp. SP17BM10]
MNAVPGRVRARVAVISVLPVLFPALLLLTVLAMVHVMPWPVVPAVAVALLVQAALTYLRLGHCDEPGN